MNRKTFSLLGLMLFNVISLHASDIVLTTLTNFTAANADYVGAIPHTGLLEGADGFLYGTTAAGGKFHVGNIFRVSPKGIVESIFQFDRTNGAAPYGALIQGVDGTLYGTAFGGSFNDAEVNGSAFALTTNGDFRTLCWLSGTNGNGPKTGLKIDSNGSLYGTTSREGLFDFGTVFQLTPDGILNTLVQFDGTNGIAPYDDAALVEGPDGQFYGTTSRGGMGSNDEQEFGGAEGTVFKITTNGVLTTLISFTNSSGANPLSGLLSLGDGTFLGTTHNGGNYFGTIFRIGSAGDIATLHTFNHGTGGYFPYPALIRGNDGNFYGTTDFGGDHDRGTVFRLSSNGVVATLFSFSGTNGWMPNRLIQARDGNFYGTTLQGGSGFQSDPNPAGLGTVFRLHIPLQPLLLSVTRTNRRVVLTWSSVAGEKYRVFYKRNEQDRRWKVLRDQIGASSGTTTLSLRLNNENAVFRIELAPPPKSSLRRRELKRADFRRGTSPS